jgi:hypothetical protein
MACCFSIALSSKGCWAAGSARLPLEPDAAWENSDASIAVKSDKTSEGRIMVEAPFSYPFTSHQPKELPSDSRAMHRLNHQKQIPCHVEKSHRWHRIRDRITYDSFHRCKPVHLAAGCCSRCFDAAIQEEKKPPMFGFAIFFLRSDMDWHALAVPKESTRMEAEREVFRQRIVAILTEIGHR